VANEAELNQLEARVTSLKEEKIRTETKLTSLRQQKDTIIAEITALGITPTTAALEEAITQAAETIEAKMAAIKDKLPPAQ